MIRAYLSLLLFASIGGLFFVAIGLPWSRYAMGIGLFAVGGPIIVGTIWLCVRLVDKVCDALHL